MDTLWTPWRYAYIKSGSDDSESLPQCVFCSLQEDPREDKQKFILHRAEYNFIVLNVYPYISGHLLIVPYLHVGELDELPSDVSNELMDLAKRSQTVLRETYHPQGFNVGINLGRAAGAGVAGHIHVHVMPRWIGDSNFMATVGETRVIPEDLKSTYEKLVGKF